MQSAECRVQSKVCMTFWQRWLLAASCRVLPRSGLATLCVSGQANPECGPVSLVQIHR
jgi:hypothetical protein